jgi:hypothetical protein
MHFSFHGCFEKQFQKNGKESMRVAKDGQPNGGVGR